MYANYRKQLVYWVPFKEHPGLGGDRTSFSNQFSQEAVKETLDEITETFTATEKQIFLKRV